MIEVAKGLSEEEAQNQICLQFKKIDKEKTYDLEIHNIQNDPKWMTYLNYHVTSINVLTFKTTKLLKNNISTIEAIIENQSGHQKLQ